MQAAAARLTMSESIHHDTCVSTNALLAMTVAMGVLSALTTGFWGQTSDRIGRTKIMAVSESGLLLKYATLIAFRAG